MRRCNSCGGVYDPDQHGGYYHQCPEDVYVDVVEKGTGIPLEGDPDPLKQYVGRRINTPFSRDENIDDEGKQKKGKHRDKGGASEVG